MYDVLQIINLIIVIIAGGYALLVTLCKPVRNKIFGIKEERRETACKAEDNRETDRCILRDMICTKYFKYKANKEISHYEYENLEHLYRQYKKLGGNSFIDRVWEEIQEWQVTEG